MSEYYTEAFVLDLEEASNSDAFVHLYTQKLGKIKARAVGIKKITSKLSGHFQPLNFVKARLVDGGKFLLVDGLSIKKINSAAALMAAYLIKNVAAEFQPDQVAWNFIKEVFLSEDEEKLKNFRMFLKAFGFEAQFDKCNFCRHNSISAFSLIDAQFICGNCVKDLKLQETIWL